MQKNTVNSEAAMIDIGGMKFELRMSDGDIYAAGRVMITECMHLRSDDPWAVQTTIQRICGVIDAALGEGAMAEIASGKPVTLAFAIKIFNVILEHCAVRYREYIRREYLPPSRKGRSK